MSRNKKRRNRVRYNEDGTLSQISKKSNEHGSNSLITRRNAIGLVIAAGAIFVGKRIIGGGDEMDAREETKSPGTTQAPDKVETKKSLSDVTQDKIVLPDNVKEYVALLQDSYESSKEIGALNFVEAIKHAPDMFSQSPEDLNAMRMFMDEFARTGFSREFNSLLKANEGHNKKNEILLVPFVHGSTDERRGPMAAKRREGWDDVARILEIECNGPHKIFFEGEGGNELVYNQWQVYIANKTKEMLGPNASAGEISQVESAMIKGYKDSRFGQMVFNPDLNIFGLEHKGLIELVRKYKAEFKKQKYKDSVFVQGFYSMFMDAILREQYVVEKAVYNLQPGEKGVIVMGAMHSSALGQYMKDKHPNLSQKMLVPKHLYLQEDFDLSAEW